MSEFYKVLTPKEKKKFIAKLLIILKVNHKKNFIKELFISLNTFHTHLLNIFVKQKQIHK